MSRVHALKTWPAPFEAMRAGRKTFEYRLNDRDFQIGDCLVLQEYNPETDSLTRECLSMRVVYVLAGGQFGIPPKYCAMSVEPWEKATPMPGAALPFPNNVKSEHCLRYGGPCTGGPEEPCGECSGKTAQYEQENRAADGSSEALSLYSVMHVIQKHSDAEAYSAEERAAESELYAMLEAWLKSTPVSGAVKP